MSHDELDSIRGNQSRLISKPRVIAGLLAEMDAASAVLLLTPNDSGSVASVGITVDFCFPFETSKITVINCQLPANTYRAQVMFAGQRIDFDLLIIDSTGTCKFPNQMTIIDLRRNKRRAFGPEIQAAEISSKHGVVFAIPIDFSQKSMALVSAVRDPALSVGETVHIKIRGDINSRDVFGFEMFVRNVDKTSATTRILLSQKENVDRPFREDSRNSFRRSIDTITISLSPLDNYVGEQIVCAVSNVSISGLRCEITEPSKASWLTPGLHVQLQNSSLYATIMWCDGLSLGLRLDALDESDTLSAWYELLRNLDPKKSVHHSQVDELVGLFTESGLLKGSRRKVFGVRPGKFLPPGKVTTNPLLFHRIAASQDDGRIYGQVSIARMTDDLWLLQEGTHAGDIGGGISYESLLHASLRTVRDLNVSSTLSPRYAAGLAHKSVKSSIAYFERFMTDPCNCKFEALQMSLKSQLDASLDSAKPDPIIRLIDLSARERNVLVNRFDATLFEVFGGWNGSHPRLNAELAQLGPNHRAETVALGPMNDAWGLAYRLKSYYSLSTTGVMNSLFLILRVGTEISRIRSGVQSLIDIGMTLGTDDLVMIIDHSTANSHAQGRDFIECLNQNFKNTKPFILFIIDSQLSKKLSIET